MRTLIALLLLTTSAMAEPPKKGWWPDPPPVQFKKPYTGVLTEVRLPLREISGKCRNLKNVWACAYHNGESCTIYIPDNVPMELMKALREHELGHCNGWIHEAPKEYQAWATKRARENPVCQTTPKPEACP
jgi:hypothetical protein